MTHLILTSALLFALLAIVGVALGACLGIARDVLLQDGNPEDEDDYWRPEEGSARASHGGVASGPR